MTALLNLTFYPFLYNQSNGLFQMIASILAVTWAFRTVWRLTVR